MMEFTAEMIAGFLGGDIVGDKETKVHTVSSIEEGKAGSLTYLTNPKYETFLYSTGAAASASWLRSLKRPRWAPTATSGISRWSKRA